MMMIFDSKKFMAELGTHRDKKVIWIKFPKDQNLINHLKSFTKPKWSSSQKSWYLIDNTQYRELFAIEENIIGKALFLKVSEVNRSSLYDLIDQLKLKAYSKNTIRTYSTEFAHLLYTIKDYPVQNLSPEKIKNYILYCINKQKISENHLHSRINAIKFYFEKVLKREQMFFEIPRPKKSLLLPKTLNAKEIAKIIQVTDNLKHRLIIQLCYGMGLRVSEISNLKVEHIDSQSMRVFIENAKGKKDRYVNLPESILPELRDYYQYYKPKNYLFEGQYGGQYSVRSVQNVFKSAMKKAKINKTIGIHGFRHSYKLLIENGADIRFLQELLGHKSS